MNIEQTVFGINPDVILSLRVFVTRDDALFETVTNATIYVNPRQQYSAILYDDKHNTVAILTYVPGPWNGWEKDGI